MKTALAVFVFLVISTGGARAQVVGGLAVPSVPTIYGPVVSHPVATNCAVDDEACIGTYDESVLMLAFGARDPDICWQFSTDPNECLDELDMLEGRAATPPDPILLDPCTIVVRIDGPKAWLYSYVEQRTVTRVATDEMRLSQRNGRATGRPAFLGKCNVDSMTRSVGAPEWRVDPEVKGFQWASVAPSVQR